MRIYRIKHVLFKIKKKHLNLLFDLKRSIFREIFDGHDVQHIKAESYTDCWTQRSIDLKRYKMDSIIRYTAILMKCQLGIRSKKLSLVYYIFT